MSSLFELANQWRQWLALQLQGDWSVAEDAAIGDLVIDFSATDQDTTARLDFALQVIEPVIPDGVKRLVFICKNKWI